MMILPVLKEMTVTLGVTFDYRFQYLQGNPTSSLPYNLTGYSGLLTISSWNGETIYNTLASGASEGESGIFFGGATNDPTNGTVDLIIVGSDTAAITWNYARYNMTLTDPYDDVTRLLYGSFTVFGFLP